MPYNPLIHHRRSIRLKGYDYSQAGMYFVTICCRGMICRFGKIKNGEMILNDYGKIAHNEWEKLSIRYSNVLLDVFQIMPNHIHGIIVLNEMPAVGATLAVAQNNATVAQNNATVAVGATLAVAQNGATVAQNNGAVANQGAGVVVGDIVGAYKSLVANQCLEIFKSNNEYMGKLWQRNYYEHIIRNDNSYQYIANYIINNPANWNNDKLYVK